MTQLFSTDFGAFANAIGQTSDQSTTYVDSAPLDGLDVIQNAPFVLNVGTLNNSGVVSADFVFGDDVRDNTLINSGRINGTVDMSIGNDLYKGRDAGFATGMVSGNKGNDRLFGASKSDEFSGGKGNDVLRGAGGNDRLFGGAGQDEINGGKGKDVMAGGGGQDTFVFQGNSGKDKIKDFTNGEDKLDLSDYDLNNFRQLKNADAIVKDGGGSKIDLEAIGGKGIIDIEDMRVSDWNGADFIF